MKVLTCSRTFPKGHPKAGIETHFAEKIMACLADRFPGWQMKNDFVLYDWYAYYNCTMPKPHTIRNGARFKPGEMVSLRVWQLPGGRYVKGNKQMEFAQVEVKKVWPVEIYATEFIFELKIDGVVQTKEGQEQVALNDGLNLIDFYNWFNMHPKKKGQVFKGQIICWSNEINY